MNKFKILKLKINNIQNLKLKKKAFLITSNLRIQIINPDKNMRKFQKYYFSPMIRIIFLERNFFNFTSSSPKDQFKRSKYYLYLKCYLINKV
jgi:hypothetical protein